MPATITGRVLVVSLLVAACALAFQTHQPQRFARGTFPVGPGLIVDAALLGRADGQLLLGVCQRREDGTSTSVRMIRVPEDRAPAYEVVAGGYAFYRKREGTLLSGMLDELGLAFRPPGLRPPWLDRPSGCVAGARTPPRGLRAPALVRAAGSRAVAVGSTRSARTVIMVTMSARRTRGGS